jgi:hypothetical protein
MTSFSKKEREHADEQCGQRPGGRQALERLRQQRKQRHTQQRTDGVADRPRYYPDADGITQQKED